MDKKRYPPNWNDIATEIKRNASWKCQECGLSCFRDDGQPPNGLKVPSDKSMKEYKSIKAKHTLTVHHMDCCPENNKSENLIALCSACHLLKHRNRRGNIHPNQLSLL